MELGLNNVNDLLHQAVTEKNKFFDANHGYKNIVDAWKNLPKEETDHLSDMENDSQNHLERSDVELRDLHSICDDIYNEKLSVLKIFYSEYNKHPYGFFSEYVKQFFTSAYNKCLMVDYINGVKKGSIKTAELSKTLKEVERTADFDAYQYSILNKQIFRFLPNIVLFESRVRNGYQVEDTKTESLPDSIEETKSSCTGVLLQIFRLYFTQVSGKDESWDKVTIDNISWSHVDAMISVITFDMGITQLLDSQNRDNIKKLLQENNVSPDDTTIVETFLCKEITYLIFEKVKKDRLNINGLKQLKTLYDCNDKLLKINNSSGRESENLNLQQEKLNKPDDEKQNSKKTEYKTNILLLLLLFSLAGNAWLWYGR